MLPSAYRLHVENATGVSVDVELNIRGVQLDSSNLEPSYAGSWRTGLGATGLADGSFHNTAEQDNTADGFLLIEVEVVVSNFSGTPGGDLNVYLQPRGNDSTDWPDNGRGRLVLSRNFTSTGTYRETEKAA